MKQEIDRPIAQLVLDLVRRGLLGRTLVVLASEFSRDMTALGVSPRTAFEVERRPFYVTQDGKGRPVNAPFAKEG